MRKLIMNKDYTVKELKAIAKELGLKGYSRLNKADLFILVSGELFSIEKELIDNTISNRENQEKGQFSTYLDGKTIHLYFGNTMTKVIEVSELGTAHTQKTELETMTVYHGGTAYSSENVQRSYMAENGGLGYHVTPMKEIAEGYGEVHTYVFNAGNELNMAKITPNSWQKLISITRYWEAWSENEYSGTAPAYAELMEYNDTNWERINDIVNATGEIKLVFDWLKGLGVTHCINMHDTGMNSDGVIREIIIIDGDSIVKVA